MPDVRYHAHTLIDCLLEIRSFPLWSDCRKPCSIR